MSYDLVFWRQNESDGRAPMALYEAFNHGQVVDGIPDLPIEDFLARLVDAFPEAVREPNGDSESIEWADPDSLSSFHVEWTSQCVWIACRPLDEPRANLIIDIANMFGCALYDPQTNERFGLSLAKDTILYWKLEDIPVGDGEAPHPEDIGPAWLYLPDGREKAVFGGAWITRADAHRIATESEHELQVDDGFD